MAADVKITMNTETYGALRALLRFEVDGDREAFLAYLKGQGRSVTLDTLGDFRAYVAEEAVLALR